MKRAVVFFVALVVVAGAIVGVVVAKTHQAPVTLPTREVDTFLHSWERANPHDMATLLDAPPADLATVATGLVDAVPGSTATYTRTGISGTAKEATATYHGAIALHGLGTISWNGLLALVKGPAGWRITWKPDALYPGLAAGQHLTVARTWPARASIFAADGSVLAGNRPLVAVGLEPDHIRTPADLAAVKFAFQSMLGVDGATVDAKLRAPGVRPNYFVEITRIPKDANYPRVHDALVVLNGVFFRQVEGVVATDPVLGNILGTVGEITAERLRQLGAPYTTGDRVGLSGLQATYETRLAGTPRTDVVVRNAKSETVKTIKRFAGTAPQPVKLTIDPPTQRAAEAALASVRQNAGFVAIDPATGAIRAVVSKPDGGFDRALAGTYPPGSTFKIVTTAALLAHGANGSTPAPCPATLNVGGREFHNFEGEAPGPLDLASAFKLSCNNAFIGLADTLPAGALDRAAAQFGFNTRWKLGVESYGGSYPAPKDRTERAASAIGQGRVLASPLQMASVSAAVAQSRWHAPSLVALPKPAAGPSVAALDSAVDATLRSFMASVVQPGGTAAGAGVPAGTFGKTGTAEFGDNTHTHAWFTGFRGDVAFAVVVEGGGVGGQVAAPIAAAFLRALGA
jgi:cell division protein FtsI/penicillin-binding protein 2